MHTAIKPAIKPTVIKPTLQQDLLASFQSGRPGKGDCLHRWMKRHDWTPREAEWAFDALVRSGLIRFFNTGWMLTAAGQVALPEAPYVRTA